MPRTPKTNQPALKNIDVQHTPEASIWTIPPDEDAYAVASTLRLVADTILNHPVQRVTFVNEATGALTITVLMKG